jgi:hypothetical protein
VGSIHSNLLCFPTGKDGILYAPKFFNETVFDKIYLKLCPACDDAWFKFMSLMNGTGAVILGKDFQEIRKDNIKTLFHSYAAFYNRQIGRIIKYLKKKKNFDFYKQIGIKK